MRAKTLVVTAGCLAIWSAAYGASLDVFPGAGTPLQDAIDNASAGDTLLVHIGTYNEAVVIDKPLKLIGDGAGVVTIDAGCSATAALSVEADGVTIRGITVTKGSFFAINIEQQDRITVRDTITLEGGCGGGFYGINLFNSTAITLKGNEASGFLDAGLYIGGIAADAKVKLEKNNCHNNDQGIIVEDSFPNSVAVKGNTASDNNRGIFVHNSDGIRVTGNTLNGNVNASIELDGTSDDNRVSGNAISDSDSIDNGTNNCWKGNTYTNATGPAICP